MIKTTKVYYFCTTGSLQVLDAMEIGDNMIPPSREHLVTGYDHSNVSWLSLCTETAGKGPVMVKEKVQDPRSAFCCNGLTEAQYQEFCLT